MKATPLRIDGSNLALPAFATAHSHAFQRGMRGKAQRPGPNGTDDFWSWREAMYSLAERLDPESIHRISSVAYAELHRRGVRTVGEFHYVHHQSGGIPYDDRTVLADAVIAAAKDAGLRIAMLRVVYNRAGVGRPAEGAQTRFSDARLDDALRDVDTLAARYRDDPHVRVGIAPHSVRAVPQEWLREIAVFSNDRKLMTHMHVAEQRAEIEACVAETGRRPVELVADCGLLSPRFVAVHATHLAPHEASMLGRERSFVCLCPTTERDLGDGLPDVTALVASGARLSVGVDSHVVTSPLEDIRAIETGERLRLERRVTLPVDGTLAAFLWEVGSHESARACGFDDAGTEVRVRRDHPDLALVEDDELLDALVFSAGGDVLEGS
jgi:formimidoylglutamate deiminase